MGLAELLLTAVALSMDAMAVSISSGIAHPRAGIGKALLMAGFFGVFQAAMPLAGYFIIPLLSTFFGSGIVSFVENFDHWIAFVLLAFIGGKMIYEELRGGDEPEVSDPFAVGAVLVMAVATSIDALATGIVFRGFDLSPGYLTFAVLAIGLITFGLSFMGVLLGKKLGEKFKRFAVLAGGAALVLLGIKILLEHLLSV